MASAGGVGTLKVAIIRSMTADTGARRTTDSVALSCTIDSQSAHTVGTRTIAETTVRGRQLRIDVTVLAVCVCCTGCIVDIRNDIRTAMAAGTLGRTGEIGGMPGVSGCSVMTGEVGVVPGMAYQTGARTAGVVECSITSNYCAKSTVDFSTVLEAAVSYNIDMAVLTVVSVDRDFHITRAVTVSTLGCTGGYHVGCMGVRRMQ